MYRLGRKTAEEKFAEIQKKRENALRADETARQQRAEHISELKQRRLSKEAEELRLAKKVENPRRKRK